MVIILLNIILMSAIPDIKLKNTLQLGGWEVKAGKSLP